MSQETDRVPVPTNGRRPHPAPTPDAPVVGDNPPSGGTETPAATADRAPDATPTIAVTPAQLAVGFGVLASLILLVVGRRRRGRKA